MSETNTISKEVRFKNLAWFFTASTSLLLTGFVLNGMSQPWLFGILVWCNFIGVFLVYRLNDCIDQDRDLKFNLRYFFSFWLHRFVVGQFLFITVPLALFFLPFKTICLLGFGAFVGIMYSINFKFWSLQFRLKNMFLIKNILIGAIWGSLVVIGAVQIYTDPIVYLFFLFASLQVFIGGMIRDVPDLEKDRTAGVQSFPVVIGVKPTIWFMHCVNFLSLILFFWMVGFSKESAIIYLVPIGIPVLWRFINLILLDREPNNPKWSQWMNLFTCVLIPLSIFIQVVFIFTVYA